jgi:hypothetical protein
MFQPMAYEQGVRLRGKPLWFDASRRRELCVLTSLEARLPLLHRRTLASSPLAAALQAAGLAKDILPSPWRRPLGVAGLRMQLIDAAAPLGGAAALLEIGAGEALMMGLLRQQPADWPTCASVTARLPALLHMGQGLPAVALQAAQALESQLKRGGPARLFVEHFEVGVVLLQAISAMGVPIVGRGNLHRLWQAVPGLPAPSAVLGCASVSVGRPVRALPPGAVVVDTGLGLFAGVPGLADTLCMQLQYFANVAQVLLMLEKTGARHLTVAQVSSPGESALRRALGRRVSLYNLQAVQQLLLGA